tara:strand:+ start:3323 stop:4321 length:999 start_codon:yes stop_codon:yes gene_type:complete
MKITKEYLERNVDKFNIPDIPIKGIKVIGIKILHRNMVNNDTIYGQHRVHDEITNRVDKLEKSFKGGLDFNQPIPIVEERTDGIYDRIDGFGRDGYFEVSNVNWYAHIVVECSTPRSKRALRIWSNRKLPKWDNTEHDLQNSIIEAVEMKEMKNSEKAFKDFLKECEPHLDKVSKGKVLTAVMDRLKTNKPKNKTWTYTDKSIKTEWIDKCWESEPVYGFQTGNDYNEGGDCHQIALPYSYEDTKLYTAVRNWIKHGKVTEIILHVIRGVKGLDSLNKGRKKCLSNIEEYKSNLDKLYGKKLKWNKFLKIKGFVPQHVDENIKKLIPINNIK